MAGRDKLPYAKIDPWIKANKEGSYVQFCKENPKITMSGWTFRKRRAKLLGLPVCPSMEDSYRGRKTPRLSGEEPSIRRSQQVYTSIYTRPVEELRKLDGVQGANEMIVAINKLLKLHLESAMIEVIGSGVQNFEVRRYTR
jgi:hypothetical protein